MNLLWKKLLYTLLFLFFFRLGSNIPIPGLDSGRIENFFFLNKINSTIFDIFSGGSFSKLSLFTLGIIPYITSSIIFQVLCAIYKPLINLKKEGLLGQEKINFYIRCFSFLLSLIQSITLSFFLSISLLKNDFNYFLMIILTLTTGSILVLWICESINVYGIGNGVSFIIYIGILSSFSFYLSNFFNNIYNKNLSINNFLLISIVFFTLFIIILIIEQSYYKISVNFLSKQIGTKIYAAQKSFLPLKLNISGVIAPIFSSNILLFFITIFQFFSFFHIPILNTSIKFILTFFYPGSLVFIIFNTIFIIIFCFLYSKVVFHVSDISNSLKENNGFIIGYRPGIQTTFFLSFVLQKLTIIGSFYIAFIVFFFDFISYLTNGKIFFGGTSLLIVIIVSIDLLSSIQTFTISGQYDKYKKQLI